MYGLGLRNTLQDNPEWNQTQLTSYNKVLDEFQKYDNLAGVFVGNEVLNFGESFETSSNYASDRLCSER